MATTIGPDSSLFYDFLPDDIANDIFARVRNEISWTKMAHKGGDVPRLVSLQYVANSEGDEPIYRHPVDTEPPSGPLTPTVDAIRHCVEAVVKQQLNHCLIQLYRNGHDFIGEHSDKTIDTLKGTAVCNVSLGATRQMVFKPKQKSSGRVNQRLDLPHNSLFALGWETNRVMTHAIRKDKRSCNDKRPDELAFDGERISLTFRSIATWRTNLDGFPMLYGQGAPAATKTELRKRDEVTNEIPRLLEAFSAENKESSFDWDYHYGAGFSVINTREDSAIVSGHSEA